MDGHAARGGGSRLGTDSPKAARTVATARPGMPGRGPAAGSGETMPDGSQLGVYVHVPFCAERCSYCDFAIVTRQERLIPDFIDSIGAQAASFRRDWGRRSADSLSFGGGSPSRLEGDQFVRLVDAAAGAVDLAAGAELSLEANPEEVDAERLAGWKRAGIRRVSLGLQSLDDGQRRRLGRPGGAERARRGVVAVLDAGFDSVGFDLIFGAPGQTLADWSGDLDRALALQPDHVSCYALETTGRTPLVRAIERGELPAPDPDLAAGMYAAASSRLAAGGWQRYEISNFARTGHESRHNLKYWRNQPYLGLGPSAASYVDGRRWTAERSLSRWLRTGAGLCPWDAAPELPFSRLAGEALVFGLRLEAGVDLGGIADRYGSEVLAERRQRLERGVREGFVLRSGRAHYRLSDRGRLVADELLADLL